MLIWTEFSRGIRIPSSVTICVAIIARSSNRQPTVNTLTFDKNDELPDDGRSRWLYRFLFGVVKKLGLWRRQHQQRRILSLLFKNFFDEVPIVRESKIKFIESHYLFQRFLQLIRGSLLFGGFKFNRLTFIDLFSKNSWLSKEIF